MVAGTMVGTRDSAKVDPEKLCCGNAARSAHTAPLTLPSRPFPCLNAWHSSPAHCIEYAKIILWPREHPDTTFDPGEFSQQECVEEVGHTARLRRLNAGHGAQPRYRSAGRSPRPPRLACLPPATPLAPCHIYRRRGTHAVDVFQGAGAGQGVWHSGEQMRAGVGNERSLGRSGDNEEDTTHRSRPDSGGA